MDKKLNLFKEEQNVDFPNKKKIELIELKTQFTLNLLDISEKENQLRKIKTDTFVFNPEIKEIIEDIKNLKARNSEIEYKINKLEENVNAECN